MKNHKPSERKKDVFFEILKERVASVLKEKGIDPVNDRGANFGRTMHYLLIIGAWLTSGYWHVKVCNGCGAMPNVRIFPPQQSLPPFIGKCSWVLSVRNLWMAHGRVGS